MKNKEERLRHSAARADSDRLAVLIAVCMMAASIDGRAVDINVRLADQAGMPLQDAVVVAVPNEGAPKSPAARASQAIQQIDQEFVPRVKAVPVGSSVSFPNRDRVRHHVYSFSPAKRFELPLYSGTPAQPVLFDRPGVVVLGCNIHDWMLGYIYVSGSPYFAQTGQDGRARLQDLPSRRFTLHVWHPQLDGSEESTRKSADLTSGRNAELAWDLRTKPEIRVRRAPSSSRRGSY